jgi:uncharacterized membrane protein
MKKKQALTLQRALPYILIVGGGIGLLCSFILTLDTIQLYKHPDLVLNCDLNPIISCGSVMKTPQSEALGFPNPIAGLIGYTFLPVVGLAMLAGAKFKRWFWWAVQACVTFAIGFTIWFQYQSMTNINALCPFCVVVWAVTIPLFLYTTFYNLREGHIPTPVRLKGLVSFLQKYHGETLAVWYLIIIVLILNHFWYYWQTLL